jgi:hypothetical protein
MQTNTSSRRTFVDPYASRNAAVKAKKSRGPIGSVEVNQQFNTFCAELASDWGVAVHVARNIVRRTMNTKPQAPQKRVWTDPKTGSVLTAAQWETPSRLRARFSKEGTNTEKAKNSRYGLYFEAQQDPQITYDDAIDEGMVRRTSVVLWDKFDVSMNAAQVKLENLNTAMKESNDEEIEG